MRLHYFTTAQFGLEAIRDKRLKIARINELNDPFEFLGLALRNNIDREKLRKFKNRVDYRIGLICMSQDWQHPLLWSHYADKHRGLCLGFDVSLDINFKPVEYTYERPTLRKIGKTSLSDVNEDDLVRFILIKFDAWKYESEWRCFCPLVQKDPVSDLYFFPLSAEVKLAQVIVGEKSLVTREKLASVLGESAGSVTSFKARAGFNRFEVVENKSQKAWK